MPCNSTVTATLSGGQIEHVQFCCGGACSPGVNCCLQITFTPQGGSRSWCGCGPKEPAECHIVVLRAPGAAPEVICAGTCSTGQKCELTRKIVGNNFVYSCECAKG